MAYGGSGSQVPDKNSNDDNDNNDDDDDDDNDNNSTGAHSFYNAWHISYHAESCEKNKGKKKKMTGTK